MLGGSGAGERGQRARVTAQSAAGLLGGDRGADLPPDENKEPPVTMADHRATSQQDAPWEEL